MNENSGFLTGTSGSGIGFDLQWVFSLANTYLYINGIAALATPNPGFADFIGLYQEYAIDSVELQVFFDSNVESLANAGDSLPIFITVSDLRDANDETASQLLQYQNVRVNQLGNIRTADGLVYRVRPRCAENIYNTTVTNGYKIAAPGTFLNTDLYNVPHYGLKHAYDPVVISGASNLIGHVSFYAKYNLRFRRSD
jgi:hypothetical protein